MLLISCIFQLIDYLYESKEGNKFDVTIFFNYLNFIKNEKLFQRLYNA